MKKDTNQTILIASAVIAIALIFNGFTQLKGGSFNGENLETEIEKGIQNFIQKQQEEADKARELANAPTLVEGNFEDNDAVLGDPNAPVTIIEFSDYECPFCKRHFTQTMPQIKKNYIDTGKVKLIFRDFPLGFHQRAEISAIAAECVGEQLGDKGYYAYHDALFKNSPASLTDENLKKQAVELGANGGKYDECIKGEKYVEEVQKDLADGQRAGISGTPGFLINNRRISGAQPYSAFEKIIEEELNK